MRLGLFVSRSSFAVENYDDANAGVVLVIPEFFDEGIACEGGAAGVQALHFRPTENRAMAIDDKIACAHGSFIPWQLAVLRPRIFFVWRGPARDASILAWLFCARDKLYDVCVWCVCEVVDPCVPSIGRAGQARKNWALS